MSQLVKKRKHRKKRTGLTSQEEKKIKKQFTYGQTEIGSFLGADRSTVARWCREGLPHERGTAGKEHRIELRTALHWSIGHQSAIKRGLELSVLEKILWPLATEELAGNKHATLHQWKAQMLEEFDWFDVTRDQLNFSIGRLSAFGCLPFRQSRW